jgi:hypothetical protein
MKISLKELIEATPYTDATETKVLNSLRDFIYVKFRQYKYDLGATHNCINLSDLNLSVKYNYRLEVEITNNPALSIERDYFRFKNNLFELHKPVILFISKSIINPSCITEKSICYIMQESHSHFQDYKDIIEYHNFALNKIAND